MLTIKLLSLSNIITNDMFLNYKSKVNLSSALYILLSIFYGSTPNQSKLNIFVIILCPNFISDPSILIIQFLILTFISYYSYMTSIRIVS